MKELVTIQKELKAPKGQFNSFGKYKYRSCEDILEAVKPLATSLGCTVTLSDSLEMIGERYYVKATARLTSGEGETAEVTAYAREAENQKGMDASQITGTASSYARKYALNGLFAIDDTKDADTDEMRRLQNAERKGTINEKWMAEQEAKMNSGIPAWPDASVENFEKEKRAKETAAKMPTMSDVMWRKTIMSEAQGKKTVDGERIKEWWIRTYRPGPKQIEMFDKEVLEEIAKMGKNTDVKTEGKTTPTEEVKAEPTIEVKAEPIKEKVEEDMPLDLGF